MNDFDRSHAHAIPQGRADMAVDAGLRSFMLGVYNKLALGLLLSAALAYITAEVPAARRRPRISDQGIAEHLVQPPARRAPPPGRDRLGRAGRGRDRRAQLHGGPGVLARGERGARSPLRAASAVPRGRGGGRPRTSVGNGRRGPSAARVWRALAPTTAGSRPRCRGPPAARASRGLLLQIRRADRGRRSEPALGLAVPRPTRAPER